MKKHNFSAGPCILPQEVLQEASQAILNFDNLDLSLIEISHRSKSFVAVMDEAVSLVKELLEVPEAIVYFLFKAGLLYNL
jgi:phosphoserine aminotransferase